MKRRLFKYGTVLPLSCTMIYTRDEDVRCCASVISSQPYVVVSVLQMMATQILPCAD
jgi:hypothetical protein